MLYFIDEIDVHSVTYFRDPKLLKGKARAHCILGLGPISGFSFN